MDEGQEYQWHIELASMRDRVRFALDNLDSIGLRSHVQNLLESVHRQLDELYEMTGEKE